METYQTGGGNLCFTSTARKATVPTACAFILRADEWQSGLWPKTSEPESGWRPEEFEREASSSSSTNAASVQGVKA